MMLRLRPGMPSAIVSERLAHRSVVLRQVVVSEAVQRCLLTWSFVAASPQQSFSRLATALDAVKTREQNRR
jgi:hypothetical protein